MIIRDLLHVYVCHDVETATLTDVYAFLSVYRAIFVPRFVPIAILTVDR
jgi:hypothetical protein